MGQPDELGREPEGIGALEGGFDRLAGRPDEEHQRDDQLGRHKQIGQRLVGKYCAFGFHRLPVAKNVERPALWAGLSILMDTAY